MAHVAKYTRNATKNLTRHYERAKDKDDNYIKFGNQDIDTTKTHLNYNLAPNRDNQGEFIKQRCDELNCVKRDNINVMCSWVVTAPKDLPVYEQDEFFKQSYKFLKDRYGKENVVSAYVHLDESSPHMHYSFVPVVFDKKKDKYKVSAKDCVNRTDLQTFHKDLSKHMERHFGRDMGILNESTREGNKSIEDLKRVSATQRIEMIDAKYSRLMEDAYKSGAEIVRNAEEKAKELQERIESLRDNKSALEGQIEALKQDLKGTLNTYDEIDRIGKKVLGKIVVQPNELKELKIQAKSYISSKFKIKDLEEDFKRADDNVRYLRPENKKLRSELWDNELELRKTKSELKEFKEVLNSNPQLKKAFNIQKDILIEVQKEKNLKMNNDYGMEL